jgi:hypothetical protein
MDMLCDMCSLGRTKKYPIEWNSYILRSLRPVWNARIQHCNICAVYEIKLSAGLSYQMH